jgi:hypothetical protein
MANVEWSMKGEIFGACNCNWGCPCQFNALPSEGNCTGGLSMRISEGHFDGESLAGVIWGMCAEWPGAIHEGNGRLLTYVDSSASEKVRRGIVEITHGLHSAEGTLFNIFSAMCPTKLPPVFAPITLTMDAAARKAIVSVPGVFEIRGEPIRNLVTGDPHFPRLVLPGGFEFKEADFASCDFEATGPIRMSRKQGHAHFARVGWDRSGYAA